MDKLEIGDKFYINILDNVLEYEVSKINVVAPDETKSLIIQENEDLVTLITCTPKHINSHRLLVTGKRILYENISNSQIECQKSLELKSHPKIEFIIIIILFLILCILFLFYFLIKSRFNSKSML